MVGALFFFFFLPIFTSVSGDVEHFDARMIVSKKSDSFVQLVILRGFLRLFL